MCVHFKTEVIFFHSFLSCRSPVPTATSFLPTQRLQLGRAGPGLSQLPLWCLPAKHSSGVSPGCEVRKRLHGLVFFIRPGRCLARSLGMRTPLPTGPKQALLPLKLQLLNPLCSTDVGPGASFKIPPSSVFNQVRSSVTELPLFPTLSALVSPEPSPDLSRYLVENLV